MNSIVKEVDVVSPTLPVLSTEVDQLPKRDVFVRSAYNYDMELASEDSSLRCVDVSRAVQSSRDEVDINTIVKRFGLTGQLPTDVAVPQFADFAEVFDYHSAMNVIAEAKEAFMEMPADVRARFLNDPHEFVAFASDPANLEEMRKLGLAVPKEAEDPLLQAVRDLKSSEHKHAGPGTDIPAK